MNLKVGRVCPQVGIAGTKGGRACCPQHAGNVSRHSYKLRAEDRHALPPNGKIFEKWRDSHVYVSSAPGAQGRVGRSDRCTALVVTRGALSSSCHTYAGHRDLHSFPTRRSSDLEPKEVGRVVLNTPRM